MRKAVIILMILLFNVSLISCTAEDLPDIQPDAETFATEGQGENNPEDPEAEPPSGDGA